MWLNSMHVETPGFRELVTILDEFGPGRCRWRSQADECLSPKSQSPDKNIYNGQSVKVAPAVLPKLLGLLPIIG